jgi:phosphohistidine phosphatase
MRVIIFRHGPAGKRSIADWPDDAMRPLTDRGEQRTRVAAFGLSRLLPRVDRIATSPLTRAMQTASILKEVYEKAEVEMVTALRPGLPARRVIEYLEANAKLDALILVGHQPDLGQIAALLALGGPQGLEIKKAGACSIVFDGEPKPGSGTLEWLLPPKVLRRLRRKNRV